MLSFVLQTNVVLTEFFYVIMFVFMIKGNLAHVRFVLLFNVGVCARKNTSTRLVLARNAFVCVYPYTRFVLP